MSIKSDKWIRRMAAQGMIDPFSPDQVRFANGGKIVSYGTSSYGYDVRCADDFKIFTNINSTIVDPKNFDEKSFVDFKGPVCIIPPNSFALASTVEYFRIPRSVLTVCLGKCVTGDTRVVDADTGAYLPITEMRWGKSTLAWNGRRLERAKVADFIPQGRREVFELRTRSGFKIRATANHPFLTLKKWTALEDLRVGDRIAVAREIPVFGKTPVPDWEASGLGAALDVGAADECVPQSIFMAPEASVRLFLQASFNGNGGVSRSAGCVCLEYGSNSRRLVEDVHHLLLRFGIFSRLREKTAHCGMPAFNVQIADEDQVLRFAERVGFMPDSVKQHVLQNEVSPLLAESDVRTKSALSVASVAARKAAVVSSDTNVDAPISGPIWDTVEQIEALGVEEVFDITVPGLHNFVANDFIVHNSTYARCFRGDTRVALVDGSAPTLEEMARRHDAGEMFWGYSIGPTGRLIVTYLDAPRFIGRDSLFEVELDTGESVHATPDHLFLRRDGRMTAAHELRPGDALMPLYRDLIRGYESVYQPIDGFLCPTHRLADEWNLRNEIYPDVPGTHRHHIDFNRRNNRPTNIERMDAVEHIRLHNKNSYGEGFDPQEHGDAIRHGLGRRAMDPAWRANFSAAQSARANEFWHSAKYEGVRARLIEARGNPSDATREAHRQVMLKRYADPRERARQSDLMIRAWSQDDGGRRSKQAEVARRLRLRSEICEQTVRRALDDTGSIRGAANLLGCDRSVFRRFPEVLAQFRGTPVYRNHKVVAVRAIAGDHDVYCLTVPEAGNFALESGVFVKNCGIIVNVTPLEPEWEGHVTLEFSNTTPLPAKIYAHEGVAQMLFFESDEVCETSYADRGGKYQGQRGVTLPKT